MLEAGCGVRETARALGLGKDTVMAYRKKWGLPAPPAGDPAAVRRARTHRALYGLPAAVGGPEREREHLLAELTAAAADLNAPSDVRPRTILATPPPPLRLFMHTFYLRRGVPIQISLPEDFRIDEAHRLCRLLKALAVPEPAAPAEKKGRDA